MTKIDAVIEGKVIYAFDRKTPAAFRVLAGSTIEVRCPDGLHGQIRSEDDRYEAVEADNVNDAVGPIYIEGAQPGDMIRFRIIDIQVPQEWGYVLTIPGFGLFGDSLPEPVTKICSIRDGFVEFGELRIPVDPCIGTIGVAPQGDPVSTLVPDDHGGNMDTRDVRAGATLYLPVFADGGLIALGDGKAAMGDGEVCGTGVGVPLNVTAHVDVAAGANHPRPVIETETEWQTIGSAPTLEGATQIAVRDMASLIQRGMGMPFVDAYMLTSLVGMLRISQVVDPQMTVRMGVAKEYVGNWLAAGPMTSEMPGEEPQ